MQVTHSSSTRAAPPAARCSSLQHIMAKAHHGALRPAVGPCRMPLAPTLSNFRLAASILRLCSAGAASAAATPRQTPRQLVLQRRSPAPHRASRAAVSIGAPDTIDSSSPCKTADSLSMYCTRCYCAADTPRPHSCAGLGGQRTAAARQAAARDDCGRPCRWLGHTMRQDCREGGLD